SSWTSSEWRMWLLTYGPVVLRHKLHRDHYINFMTFQRLYMIVSRRSISKQDCDTISLLAVEFVQSFERIYYGDDDDFVSVCTVQVHYLLHLAQDIKQLGPAGHYAQWPHER
ncbi:hypothetical protein BDV96DRAFT_453667, partial [Lophiotrema nucula]